MFVCEIVCVGVGAARPGPVQLYYSVDLHSKLYMLVFTFCFSNKIPWSNALVAPYFRDPGAGGVEDGSGYQRVNAGASSVCGPRVARQHSQPPGGWNGKSAS